MSFCCLSLSIAPEHRNLAVVRLLLQFAFWIEINSTRIKTDDLLPCVYFALRQCRPVVPHQWLTVLLYKSIILDISSGEGELWCSGRNSCNEWSSRIQNKVPYQIGIVRYHQWLLVLCSLRTIVTQFPEVMSYWVLVPSLVIDVSSSPLTM